MCVSRARIITDIMKVVQEQLKDEGRNPVPVMLLPARMLICINFPLARGLASLKVRQRVVGDVYPSYLVYL